MSLVIPKPYVDLGVNPSAHQLIEGRIYGVRLEGFANRMEVTVCRYLGDDLFQIVNPYTLEDTALNQFEITDAHRFHSIARDDDYPSARTYRQARENTVRHEPSGVMLAAAMDEIDRFDLAELAQAAHKDRINAQAYEVVVELLQRVLNDERDAAKDALNFLNDRGYF